jgi:hypothetical protein
VGDYCADVGENVAIFNNDIVPINNNISNDNLNDNNIVEVSSSVSDIIILQKDDYH